MAIDLSKFILSANNSGGQRLTPSEQLGLAYKQQNQFAESSTRAYQQAMAQGSAAAIPLAFAMGLERRRANEALGRYNQAITKEAEDRDMMLNQFGANLPKEQQSIWNNMPRDLKEKVMVKNATSQFTPREPNFELRETPRGTVRIDKNTGDVFPVTGKDGSQIQAIQRKPNQININTGPKLTKPDEKLIDRAFEKADAADSALAEINELIKLNEEIETGPGPRVLAKGAEIVDALTFGTVSPDSLTKYQRFEALATGLGAKALQLFGGNDSNRELLVALLTTAGLNKTNAANRAILQRKKIASDILSERPDFITQWVNDNGSALNLNAKGQSFGSAWKSYQKQKWNELTKNIESVNLSKDERSSILGDVKRFLNKKPSRREKLESMTNEEILRSLNS